MFHKKLFSVLAMLLCMTVSFGAFAQKQTVSGIVSDAIGPVVGAVVQAEGANAVTDMDGRYTITVSANAVLEVSCLGYKAMQVPVNGQNHVNITLEEDSFALEEAVAVGYGTTKKANLTGA
ncbi:MAG: carboxypeptidase-like regulatory domain-containing protein, partial [Bacteroidales bacterium]|nr:carboxypeptidase-like regulatory domain-containing protein [Bacteroidales bacterium]